jgi:hypothetical protein
LEGLFSDLLNRLVKEDETGYIEKVSMIQDCLAISWHGRRLVYWIVALLVS